MRLPGVFIFLMIYGMCQIMVYPGGLVFHEKTGIAFKDFFVKEGLLVDLPCGGRGLCNQCRIKIDPPTASGREGRKPLPAGLIEKGFRLACQAVVEGDCTVTIPEGKDVKAVWKDRAKESERFHLAGAPLIVRKSISVGKPSLQDQRADWERLVDTLQEAGLTEKTARPDRQLLTLESFSLELRENDWQVEAVLENEDLLCLRAVSDEPIYGFAIDLGTTTVDVSLHDLESGTRIARKTFLNRQAAFGADVVSRVHNFQDSRQQVRQAALETISDCAEAILEEQNISASQIVRSVVVGNPIMIHILHDLNPFQLSISPYIPLISGPIRRGCQHFGWNFQGCGQVETLPLISAFIGADTLGMILALDLEHEQGTTLSVDIGTNGEIVLSRPDGLYATSAAAGPAFEGAQISCGMRAAEGAIVSVAITENGAVEPKTIGGGPAKGICGSGLISAVAELLDAELMDSTGRLKEAEEIENENLKPRLIQIENRPAFLLSSEANIYITQKDIRELQLAKGAIRTAIDMLMRETGVTIGEIDKIRLAGNFGSGVDIASSIRLGLIPDVDPATVDVVGNAALRGAALFLVSRDYRERALHVHDRCRFLELAANPAFQTHFMQSMLF